RLAIVAGDAQADPVVTTVVATLRVGAQRSAFAARLVLGAAAEAVLPQLSGDAADPHRAVFAVLRFIGARHPVPARRIAGVGVVDDARARDRRAEVAVATVEPQTIFLDRAT